MTDRAEAARHEESFLGNLSGAQDEYDWLIEHEAWLPLGWGSFADWWTSRVMPLMRALSMRPTREIAARVVEQVRTEEQALPPAQRRTQQELAELAGTSEWAVRGRQDLRERRTAAPSDLAPPSVETARPVADLHVAPEPDYSDLDAQLDAAMEDTDTRFRRNFSTAMRRACEVWSFDAERVAEAYAADFDAEIERGFMREMDAFFTRVRHARRARSGLRVVNGGLA